VLEGDRKKLSTALGAYDKSLSKVSLTVST
jgi:hypothetical protein